MEHGITTLPMAGAGHAPGACGCGGSCGCGGHEHTPGTHTRAHHTHTEESLVSTQALSVTGMTCGHCVHAVTAEVQHIPGVTAVSVDLVAGGTSTVTVAAVQPVARADVAAALARAGDYQLASS